MPNLILNEMAIREFVMEQMTVKNVVPEFGKLLYDTDYRNKIFEKYARLKELMGEPGAAGRAAMKMVGLLK